ncbi:hypothetical protein Tco_0576918 [Tanacetum coccineum]
MGPPIYPPATGNYQQYNESQFQPKSQKGFKSDYGNFEKYFSVVDGKYNFPEFIARILNSCINRHNHWFSFAKGRVPALRAILDSMPWRHADSVTTDPKPLTGSYDETKVRKLSAYVVTLRDMLEGVLRLSFYCTPVVVVCSAIPEPTMDELTATVPDTKVAKQTRSAMKHAASGSAQKNLFDESSDDEVHEADEQNDDQDDDCVEILLITPIKSTAKLPFEGKQGMENSAPFAAEGAQTKDIMDGRVDTPSGNVGRPQSSVSADPFVDEGGLIGGLYQINRKEWELPHDPAFEIVNKEVFKDPEVCKAIVDLFPTSAEVVRVETLSDEQLTKKLSVLHCEQMGTFNEKVEAYETALIKAKENSKARKKKTNSLSKSLDQFTVKGAHVASALNDVWRAEAQKSDQIDVA